MENCENLKKLFRKFDMFRPQRSTPPNGQRSMSNRPTKGRPKESPSVDNNRNARGTDQRQPNYANVRCYNCGQMGHTKSRCTQPINKEKQRQITIQKEQQKIGQNFRKDTPVKAMTGSDPQPSSLTGWQADESTTQQSHDVQPQEENGNAADSENITTNSLQMYGMLPEQQMTTAQKLNLLSYTTPGVQVFVGGKEVQAMIDTGSVITVIQTDLAKQLPGQVEPWVGTELKAIEGNSVVPRGYKMVKLTFLSRTYELPMMIIDKVWPSIILGQNFNLLAGIDINCQEKRIRLPPLPTAKRVENTRPERQEAAVKRSSQTQPMPTLTKKVQAPKQRVLGQTSSDESTDTSSTDSSMYKCTFEDSQLNIWDVDLIQHWEDKEKEIYGGIYGRLEEFQRFEPNQSKVVNFTTKHATSGDYLIKTRKKYRQKGWRVEEGVVNPNKGINKLIITNQMPHARRLFAGKRLVSLRKLEEPPIDIPVNQETPINGKGRQFTRRKKWIAVNALSPHEEKIWSAINSEPPAEETLLTPNERERVDDDQYFRQQTDEEFLSKFNVAQDISWKQKYMFQQLFKRYRNCFALDGDSLGQVDVWKHKIDTGDSPPVRQNPYRVSDKERKQIQESVTEMLAKGVIVPNVSSWASPVTLVPKRDGTIRFCIDYRKLNAITKDDVYPIPHLEEPLALMKDSDRFSVMDCDNCYWQIVMDPESAEKTTFTCHMGTFMFKVMPFGLKCAPASCVRAMDRIFENENRRISFIYMDDLICFSKGIDEHIRRLSILLKRMQTHGLKLKAKKCSFAATNVNYLGHTISVDGITPDKERVEAVLEKPKPTNIREVKGFLGFAGFYRKFIQSFSRVAEPLLRLMKKDSKFVWGEEQEAAFQTLRTALLSPPILAHFNPDLITELRTDASNLGLGAHLVQVGPTEKRLLACASRTLTVHEKNYSTTEKECLAIVWAVGKFRPYLYGRQFRIVTDHCGLCFLMHTKDLVNRLARWSLRLMEYSFEIIYNKGDKHGDADYLSRNPFQEEKEEEYLVVYQLFDREQMAVDITELNRDRIIAEQRSDSLLQPIIQKLEDPSTTRREIRRLRKKYEIVDEMLWRLTRQREGITERRLEVPLSMIGEVLKDAHDKATAGHFGIRKTLWRACNHFHWRGMIEDVKNYVKSCKPCQFRKTRTSALEGWQGSVPVGENVLRVMSVDLLGPLHMTENDNKYIITVTDQISKYAIAIPVNNTLEETIVEQMQIHVFYKFGPPDILISDQGTNLNGWLSKDLYAYWGIKHIRTTPYHPQSNGQVENFNHTLAKALAIQILKYKDLWDKYVYPTTYAYNNTVNETTKYSPAELLFGLQPETSLARQLQLRTQRSQSSFTVEEKRQLARSSIASAQKKNRNRINKTRQPTKVQLGDIVLVTKKNLKTQKSGKLEDRWSGPYRIIAMSNNQINCKVSHIQTGLEKVVNLTEVKKYHDRQDFRLVQTKLGQASIAQVIFHTRLSKDKRGILETKEDNHLENASVKQCSPKVKMKQ